MINTLEELLKDYLRYSWMEEKIDEDTIENLHKGVDDYVRQLRDLNLLKIKQ